MLGVDDFLLILVATTAANLVVEVGAEVVAEWMVNSPDSPWAPPNFDPSSASEHIGYAPDFLIQVSAKVDQTATVWSGQMMERLSHKADVLGVKLGETAVWSEQMISTLGTSLGLQ
jgi:hypothetical protein